MLCISRYVALPGALRLDWELMPTVLAVYVLVCGLSVGLCVGGATRVAARRGAGGLGLAGAGALGGVLAGIAPGIMGIAGFGSLSAPYAGTANIMSSILVGAIAFVALWSPGLLPSRRERSPLKHLGHAALASVISLGAFGMVGWSLVRALDLVPSFDTLLELSAATGLLPFAIAGGVLLGAAAGAAIGAACGLVRHLDR
ncbi:MAG: hypothetical protein AB1Z98_25710 [Nannocystaceae bacterium]